MNKMTGLLMAVNILLILALKKGIDPKEYAFFALGVLALLFYLPDLVLGAQAKNKEDQVNGSFSRFAIRFIILSDVSTVYDRVFMDAVRGLEGENHLFKALHQAADALEVNGDFLNVLEELSRNLRNQQVNQFINILIQSYKYGNDQISNKLYVLLVDILEAEKKYIIIKSETSATKMILPNMLVMVAIMLIIIYPGLYQLL